MNQVKQLMRCFDPTVGTSPLLPLLDFPHWEKLFFFINRMVQEYSIMKSLPPSSTVTGAKLRVFMASQYPQHSQILRDTWVDSVIPSTGLEIEPLGLEIPFSGYVKLRSELFLLQKVFEGRGSLTVTEAELIHLFFYCRA